MEIETLTGMFLLNCGACGTLGVWMGRGERGEERRRRRGGGGGGGDVSSL